MRRIVVITGTPGTGKSFLARFLKGKIKGARVIAANDVVSERRMYNGRDKDGARLVDVRMLERYLKYEVNAIHAPLVILEGHLLCEMRIPGACAVVLRTHLAELERRLKERGYYGSKLKDNIVSEALDYCGVAASRNYSRVFEIEGTRSEMASAALAIISGKLRKARSMDFSEELVALGGGRYLS